MFVLSQSHHFPADAVAILPSPEQAGTFIEWPFKLHFEMVSEEEAADLSAITDEDLKEPGLAGVRADKRLLRRIVHGWEDVVDAAKAQVPFSAEALEEALKLPAFRLAAFAAYRKAVSGGEALRGN